MPSFLRAAAAVAAVLVLSAVGALAPGVARATPPSASFTYAPANPVPGQVVTLTSSSWDPDGGGVVEAWNLDGNGGYDVTGRSVRATFSSPGSHRVRLLVTDSWGETATASQTIHVVAPPTAPTADFSVSPSNPLAGETVKFRSRSSDPNHDIVLESWDLNGDGVFGDRTGRTAEGSFSQPGSYRVGLRVTDAAGHVTTASETVDVISASIPPRVEISASPSRAVPGQTITLQSRSTDRNDDIVEESWDLDGDGRFGDAVGRTAQTTFHTGGEYRVGLRVTDADGNAEVSTKSIKVVAGPIASFTFSPATPVTGDKVSFTSTSTAAGGKIRKWRWDLDGDGDYDDGKDSTVTRTYTKPGSYTVSLRIEDDEATEVTTFQTVQVYLPGTVPPPPAPPAPPPPPAPAPEGGAPEGGARTGSPSLKTDAAAIRKLKLLSPFPVIRIRGQILRRSARVEVLSVSAERGATVRVRCRGRGCPKRLVRLKVRSARRPVRIRTFERALRAGVVLEIVVTKNNRLGKYTKFVIRGRKAPSRRDLCVGPAGGRPVVCPAQ